MSGLVSAHEVSASLTGQSSAGVSANERLLMAVVADVAANVTS